MKNHSVTMDDIVRYLEQVEKNPNEKARFNRSMKRAAERERKRKDGEFTAMFLDAIRIP